MSIYVKEVSTKDQRFTDREVVMWTREGRDATPVPDTVVVCDGCNENIYPGSGYLVYLNKRELLKDQPYDFYCEACLKEYFKEYKTVT